MIRGFLKLFRKRSRRSGDDFADFFLHTPKEEQKRVYRDVLQKANEDQRRLSEEARKI